MVLSDVEERISTVEIDENGAEKIRVGLAFFSALLDGLAESLTDRWKRSNTLVYLRVETALS